MRNILVALAVFALACNDDPIDPDIDDQDAIQIAYFAELIETEPWTSAAAYCISTGTWENKVDPSDEVLGELRLLFGKIQPASLCQSNLQGTTYNGELARSYHIDTITVTGQTATVDGYYRQHGLDAGGYRAQLQKQGNLWVVLTFEMTWVA